MKKSILLAACLLATLDSFAQKKDFSYKFYGQIRTDLYYNSRANKETVDGLFYMYPLDKKPDADGKDLNGTANGSFYTLYTRLGVDVKGPKLGKATTSAKVEADFRGSGTTFSTVRLRHAYLNLDWGKSALLLGQTWHPLFGEVSPQILNLSVGAPFQPFSRAPQIRYQYEVGNIKLIGAAIWQSQYLSVGLDNIKSQNYIKNSCIPEFYAGIDYKVKNWLLGAGIELLSIKPRTESTVKISTNENDDNTISKTFKVDERITTLSYEAHLRYSDRNWFIAAKSVLGNNLTQTSMLGGFGIKSTDKRTGKQGYSSILNSSTWLNVVYGQKWKPGLFLGYIKNLGTGDAVTKLYGTGTDVDQLVTAGAELTYNIANWKFGLEYTLSTVWYGSLDSTNGKIIDTHSVSNHRIVGVAMFMF